MRRLETHAYDVSVSLLSGAWIVHNNNRNGRWISPESIKLKVIEGTDEYVLGINNQLTFHCVSLVDVNRDGRIDIFLGTRMNSSTLGFGWLHHVGAAEGAEDFVFESETRVSDVHVTVEPGLNQCTSFEVDQGGDPHMVNIVAHNGDAIIHYELATTPTPAIAASHVLMDSSELNHSEVNIIISDEQDVVVSIHDGISTLVEAFHFSYDTRQFARETLGDFHGHSIINHRQHIDLRRSSGRVQHKSFVSVLNERTIVFKYQDQDPSSSWHEVQVDNSIDNSTGIIKNVKLFDVDSDDDLDIVIVRVKGPSDSSDVNETQLCWYDQVSRGNFSTLKILSILPSDAEWLTLTLGDANDDGFEDVVVASDRFLVLYEKGESIFFMLRMCTFFLHFKRARASLLSLVGSEENLGAKSQTQ